jgi:hypothetical protein
MFNDKEHKDEENDKIQDILNRMTTKKPTQKKQSTEVVYDDVDFDNIDDSERKALKDLFAGIPDVYKLMGVTMEDSQEVISKKCTKKLAAYRPDRHSEIVKKYPEDRREKELKKLDIQFKLLRDADSILRDPSKRKYYDLNKKTADNKNFTKQKDSFDDFIKLQESKMSESSKKIAKLEYENTQAVLDKKHGFNRDAFNEEAPTVEETLNRMQAYERERDDDFDEFIPENRFEGRNFNGGEAFNKMFVKQKLKQQKKRNGSGTDKSIVAWEGISAANDVGIGGETDCVGIDNDYGDLYTQDNFGTSQFASILDSDNGENMSGSSDIDSEDIDLDEHDGFKYDKMNVNDRYDELMAQRQMEDTKYDEREMHDKESWKSVLDNPFSISNQMGSMLGKNDFSKLDGPRKTINKDVVDVYKELVYDDNKKRDKKHRSKKSEHKKSDLSDSDSVKKERRRRKHKSKKD